MKMSLNLGQNGSGIIEQKQTPLSSFQSAFNKADQFILDIEQMVKDELAMLEKFYVSDHQDVPFEKAINKAKRKFEKRRGPTLIKPLNKKKNRMVLGGMEFDPINQMWRGNDDDLNHFPGGRSAAPALITNLGRTEEKVVGNMKWDPKQNQWKGNEGDLTKFRTLKPALITQLNANYNTRIENGMVLDPISMKWRGNEDDLDVFETMDDQNNDNTFKVEGEFTLSKSLLSSLKESELKHNEDLKGWFPEERDLDDRDHLHSIRQMSIMKLIKNTSRQFRSSGGFSQSGNGGSSTSVLPLLQLKTTRKPVVDETNDWDDVDFDEQPTLQLNPKIHRDANDEKESAMDVSDDDASLWDKEMGFTSEDDGMSSGNDGGVSGNSSRAQTPRLHLSSNATQNTPLGSDTLNKYKDSDDNDDDDVDFSAFVINKGKSPSQHSSLKTIFGGSIKPSSGTIDGKGNSISLRRGGTLNNIPPLPVTSTQSVISTSPSSTSTFNDEFDDVEVPACGLSLRQKPHNDNFNALLDSVSESSVSSGSTRNMSPSMTSMRDVVEEEWPDVHIPADLASKRPNDSSARKTPPVRHTLEVEDYSDDISLPGNAPLQLKKPNLLIDNPFGDDSDEGWDDISFPDNFKASTPVQQPIANHLNPNNNNITKFSLTSTTSSNQPSTPIENYNTTQSSSSDSFTPLSPTSVQEILKTPPSSPYTPFKLLQRSNTNPK